MATKTINEIIPRLQETRDGVTATPGYYIDDALDPIFNKYAREYLRQKYGDSILNIPAGLIEGIGNAWGNKQGKGILGPAMGVLGYFGRTMDKADDALIGTLIEATDPTGFNNPLEQIFIEDRPYEGKELLKNLVNQSRNPNQQLQEKDMQGLGWTLAGLATDLATDPGILGGTLAKVGAKSTKPIMQNLGKVGQMMSDYDDMAAMLAWNAVAPGSTFLAKKFLKQAGDLVGWRGNKNVVDVPTNKASAETLAEAAEATGQFTPFDGVKNAKTVAEGLKRPKTPKKPKPIIPEEPIDTFLKGSIEDIRRAYSPKDLKNPQVEQVVDEIQRIEKLTPQTATKVESVVQEASKEVPELTTFDDALNDIKKSGEELLQKDVDAIKGLSQTDAQGNYLGITGKSGKPLDPLSAPSGAVVSQRVITEDRLENAIKMGEATNVDKATLQKIKDVYEQGGIERYIEENFSGASSEYDEINIFQNEILDALDEIEGVGSRYIKKGGNERFIVRASQWYPLKQYAPVKKYVDSWTATIKNLIQDSFNNGKPIDKVGFKKAFLNAFGYTEDFVKKNEIRYKELDTLKFNLLRDKFGYNFKSVSPEQRIRYLKDLSLKNPKLKAALEELDAVSKDYWFLKKLENVINLTFLEDVPLVRIGAQDMPNTFRGYQLQLNKAIAFLNEPYTRKLLVKGKSLGADPALRKLIEQLEIFGRDISDLKKAIETTARTNFSFLDATGDLSADALNTTSLLKMFLETIPLEASKRLRVGLPELLGPELIEIATKEESFLRKLLERFPQYEVIDRVTGKKIFARTYTTVETGLQFVKKNYNPALIKPKVTEKVIKENIEKTLTTVSEELPAVVKGASVPDPTKATAKILETTPVELVRDEAIEIATKLEYGSAIPGGIPPIQLAKYVDPFVTTSKRESLFSRITRAMVRQAKIEIKNYSATLQNPKLKEIVASIASVKDRPLIKKFIQSVDETQPYITKKGTFMQDLVRAGGFKLTIIKDAAQNKALRDQLTNVISVINKEAIRLGAKGDILLLNKPNARGVIGVYLNKNVPEFQNYFTIIAKKELSGKLSFNEDILWYVNKNAKAFDDVTPNGKILKENYDKGLEQLREHVTKLGHGKELDAISESGKVYIHHSATKNDKLTAAILESFEGLDVDELSKFSNGITNYLNLNKKFRSVFLTRAYEGPMSLFQDGELGKLFEDDDLAKIMNATLSEGVVANQNYQLFISLFDNENLKVRSMFNSFDEFKNALYVKDAATKQVGGNLNQLDVIKPVYKDGTLVGFKRFDKFSDKGLMEAFNDEDVILVPNVMYAAMDRLLKKDAILSNKAYLFLNKYFTLPFKFGVLLNPAFPIGNISDAFFKTAMENGVKYDRSFLKAAGDTVGSMHDIIKIENQMTNIVEEYLTNFARPGEILTPQMLVKDVKARERFFKYINSLPNETTQDIKATAYLYLILNRVQDTNVTTYFSKKMLERIQKSDTIALDSAQEVSKGLDLDLNELTSKYNVQTNLFEKILYGTPKTYGIFLNNPVSRGIMGSSKAIENLMRSAHILSVLRYEGVIDDLGKMAPGIKKSLFGASEEINIKLLNAMSTMNAAHFNYDDMTNIMAGLSVAIPFPTFFVKNLAYWLDKAMNNPQILDNIISVHENLWSDKDYAAKQDEFMGEAKGRGAIPALGSLYKPTPYASLFSAFDTLNNPVSNVAYRLNPMTRLLSQAALPSEDVKYRPYTTNIYTKNVKRGDPNFSYLRYALQSMNPYERQIQSALRLPAKIEKGKVQPADFLPSVFQPDFSKPRKK
jgi:hypothetical protein